MVKQHLTGRSQFYPINETTLPIRGPLYMPDGDGGDGDGGNGGAAAGGGQKDAAYWEAEAKKAFKDRDTERAQRKALEGKVLTDEQAEQFKALQEQSAKAEEERKRKAGEFDQWRADILKKHQTDLADRETKLTAAEQRWQKTMVGLAFAGAGDLFGKDALTIYSPKAAERIFSDYVTLDEDGNAVVKDRGGNVILDAQTGKPASFTVAMRELIESLPDKNDHLRGSGKTGSGSAGGATGGRTELDVRNLTPEQRRDPKVLAALRASLPRGGVVMGAAYDR